MFSSDGSCIRQRQLGDSHVVTEKGKEVIQGSQRVSTRPMCPEAIFTLLQVNEQTGTDRDHQAADKQQLDQPVITRQPLDQAVLDRKQAHRHETQPDSDGRPIITTVFDTAQRMTDPGI